MATPYWPEAAKVTLEDWGASATATEGTPHTSGKVLSVIPVSAGAIVFFPGGWAGTSIITKTLTKAFMSRGD